MNPERAVIPPFECAETSTRKKRGVPHFVPTQRDTILRLLREAKLRGEDVKCSHLLFDLHFTECRARINELEAMGYKIRHDDPLPGEKYVRYFLLSEPAQEKPLRAYQPKGPDPRQSTLADSPDWYERQTGQPRSAPTPEFGLEP